ncbi:type IV secretory system conjugative DNA transfer family protein [Rhizorhabdus argentea]|uniref:type IV secretory system conjugative DNA transfer family protein n=1 Tax=Rhizorhabdus argentea TaxID=1387174 RepID=UPI0030EDA59C
MAERLPGRAPGPGMGVIILLLSLSWGTVFGIDHVTGLTRRWTSGTDAMLLGYSVIGIVFLILYLLVARLYRTAPASTLLGSARFGDRREVRALEDNQGDLLIGRSSRSGRLLRYNGPAHLITIAPTRGGKGVGTIIPNLLTADRSILCIDPKGENARITSEARSRFGPVWCLDPFGVSGCKAASYNPLDALDPASPDVGDDAATLADAIVQDEVTGGDNVHWNEEARALIEGLILHACDDPLGRRTLATVRDFLTRSPEAFIDLIARMQGSSGAHGLVARAANRFAGKSDREASGVLSAAQRHTHFLDSPRIAASVSGSDFAFADLKHDVGTVFVCLPPDRIDAYSRWMRLIVAQALAELARSTTATSRPVLFLLDEFAALGRLEPVARAMGLMAGYGVQLWPILQDVHQLRHLYARRAGTFLANAGVLQAFGVNDHDTAEMLSKMMGQETIEYVTQGSSVTRGHSILEPDTRGESTSEHVAPRNLLNPDEIMRLPGDRQLLLMQGQAPLVTGRIRYYADAEFAGLFTK